MAFYKKVDDSIIFNQDGELIYYIPEKYFENGNAVIIGEYVDVMGIFSYEVYNKSGKGSGIKLTKGGTTIKCKPSAITKKPNIQLKGTTEAIPYRLLSFKKGDILICSTRVEQSITNVENFINLLIRGNLPSNIPYDKVHEYILNNAIMNNFNYNVSPQIIGLVISELYRDKNDLTKPFRLSPMKSMTDYKTVTINKIPKYTSAYTAITSENADESIASAMTNKTHKDSPLERVMMN